MTRSRRSAQERRQTSPPASLKTAADHRVNQPGGVRGRPFQPGQSGNPGGRPRSERKILERMFGEAGQDLYRELNTLLRNRKTAAKLRAQIAMFLIERLHGKAPMNVHVEGDLAEMLADRYDETNKTEGRG